MITQDYLKSILSYDEDSGLFAWKIDKGNNAKSGSIAGSLHKPSGYYLIKINNRRYHSHILAWVYVYGSFPNGEIDHINHEQGDNRIENLRDVSRVDNCRNRSIPLNNTSGIMGVYFHKKSNRWRAIINIDGKQKTLGQFADFSEAVNARKNAEVLYGYHKNHGNSKGDYNE